MVKIEVETGGRINLLTADGDCLTVAAEISAAVGDLYQRISAAHEDGGEVFRKTIEFLLGHDGRAWTVETRKEPIRGVVVITTQPEPKGANGIE